MKFWLILIVLLFFKKPSYGIKKDCHLERTHTFKVDSDVTLSFSAEIKDVGSILIDFNYENYENDRIMLSVNKSSTFLYRENVYKDTVLKPIVSEGWNDIDIFVENNNATIICRNSVKTSLSISLYSEIKSIKVSAAKLRICEESCNIETNIEKIITTGDKFIVTAFSTSNSPLTFNISNSVEEGSIGIFIMKPGNCTFITKQTKREIPCGKFNPGWNRYSIVANKRTIDINNFIQLPINTDFTTINIFGKHLVNCTKGTPTWKITSNKEVQVPITFGQEMSVILKSNVSFLPSFNIFGNYLTLNWNNGLKFGSTINLLKPKSYKIIFEAKLEMLIIYNKDKKDVLMVLKVERALEYISVGSQEGEYMLILSVEDPLQQHKTSDSFEKRPSALESTTEKAKQVSKMRADPQQITNETIIGLFLAFSSCIFIGTNFALKDSQGDQESFAVCNFIRNFYPLHNHRWWLRKNWLMVIGELLNFFSYMFAPALIVTPIGAFSIIFTKFFQKKNLNSIGRLGFVLVIVGICITIICGPKTNYINSMEELETLLSSQAFLIYFAIVVLLSIVFKIFSCCNEHLNVVICSLFGSLSVILCKGVGLAFKLSIEGGNEFINWPIWVCVITLILCLLIQTVFMQRALTIHSISYFTSINYVIFTSMVIIASSQLYKEMRGMGTMEISLFSFGFLDILIGLCLLNLEKTRK